METILIVDDDKNLCFNLSSVLKDEGYETIAVDDGKEAIKEVKKGSLNLVLLDIKLPGMDGMEVLKKAKKIDKNLAIVMLTAYGEVKDAVRAMKLGAFDYITKPFDNEELILIIKRALETQYLSREVENLRERLGEKIAIEEVMGESPQTKEVLKQVNIIAPTDMTVIIQGETGTGKEIIANLIHQKSLRRDKPFVAIDCGAIPETLVESELFGYEKGAFTGADERKEGRFEQADGGTLFLDEIVNLPEGMQTKLLRVIEESKLQHLGGKKSIKVDVRIIVATKTPLPEAVRGGRFRDDLFYRLNQFSIDLLSLKERKEDIPTLAKCFLDEANEKLNKKIKGFSTEAMKFLLTHPWPGNVRELKNVIKRAVLLSNSDRIHLWHLSLNHPRTPPHQNFWCEGTPPQPRFGVGASLREMAQKATKEAERGIIVQALAKAGGNKSKAAKILKIDRKTLYSKLKEYRIE